MPSVKLSSALPDDHGLEAIAEELIAEPSEKRLIVALGHTRKITTDVDTGEESPQVQLDRVEVIDDPQEVKALFMKQYSDEEITHHYDDRVHFPCQYSFYCEKDRMIKILENILPLFSCLKTEVLSLLRDEHPLYLAYTEELKSIIAQIDCIDVMLALFFVNLEEKAFSYSAVKNCLKKDYIYDLVDRMQAKNVSDCWKFIC